MGGRGEFLDAFIKSKSSGKRSSADANICDIFDGYKN